MADDKTKTDMPVVSPVATKPDPELPVPNKVAFPEPETAAPVEEPAPTPKERMAEIIAELTRASPAGVEKMAGELASLLEQM